MRQWYLKNKEHRSSYAHEWYLKNRELTKARSNIRYHTKKEDVLAYRAAKRNVECEAGMRVCSSCFRMFESGGYKICEQCRTKKKEFKDAKYRSIWEQHFRIKIPEGYVIHHKDKDQNNNNPHNLLCMPRDEHNKLHWDMGDHNKEENGMKGVDLT